MATFSPEQFQQLMAAITGHMQGAAAAANGRAKPLIDAKRFERLDKFSGGEDRWKDWSFDFKITVKAQDARVERAMRMVERAGEMSMDELRMADADGEARG